MNTIATELKELCKAKKQEIAKITLKNDLLLQELEDATIELSKQKRKPIEKVSKIVREIADVINNVSFLSVDYSQSNYVFTYKNKNVVLYKTLKEGIYLKISSKRIDTKKVHFKMLTGLSKPTAKITKEHFMYLANEDIGYDLRPYSATNTDAINYFIENKDDIISWLGSLVQDLIVEYTNSFKIEYDRLNNNLKEVKSQIKAAKED